MTALKSHVLGCRHSLGSLVYDLGRRLAFGELLTWMCPLKTRVFLMEVT
jgi:hypothetical protein